MTAGPRQRVVGAPYAMRASAADRDRCLRVLQAAFTEGRLTFAEFEERIGEALTARTFQRLMELTADLPVGRFGRLPMHSTTPAPARPAWPHIVVACLLLVLSALLVVAAALHAG